MADPTGFVYRAESGEKHWPDRQRSAARTGHASARAKRRLAGQFKLIRDGQIVHETKGAELDVPIEEPGVYRVEVWLTLAAEPRPWILTNPIYVRAK